MVTSENYFGRWGNTKENRREILFTDSQIRSLDADWSYPDDPARVLAAVGRLNPSVTKCHTSNTQKMTENGSIVFIASVQLNNQNQKYMEPKIEVYKKAYLTQWGWSKCLCPHQASDQ